MKTVISYGGGVQSTALILLALERWEVDEIVHVDLGDAESPQTREYVSYLRAWLRQAHQRDITVLERDLYGDMLANPQFTPVPWLGKDFMLRRQCTRQYKVEPIRRYLYETYPKEHIRLMLGISVDEYHRMRTSSYKRIEHAYPLIDERIDRQRCREIIARAGLALPGKSSCWFCPYRSGASQHALVKQYPHLRRLAEELEARINEVRVQRGKPEIMVLKKNGLEGQESFCEAGFCDA